MRITSRYILTPFFKNFFYSLIFLSILFFFQALFTDLMNQEYPVLQCFKYYSYLLPSIGVQMAGPSVLLASALTIGGFSETKELVALYSLGMSLQKILIKIISASAVIGVITFILQDTVIPYFYTLQKDYYWKEIKKNTALHMTSGIWMKGQYRIYHAQPTADQKYKNLKAYTFDTDFYLKEYFYAESAEFLNHILQLKNGLTHFFYKNDFTQSELFETRSVAVQDNLPLLFFQKQDSNSFSTKKLKKHIMHLQAVGLNTKIHEVNYYSRFSLSLVPIIMGIFGATFSAHASRAFGVFTYFSICLGIIFIYWFFTSIFLSLGIKGSLHPLVASWLPTLCFLAVALCFQIKKQQ